MRVPFVYRTLRTRTALFLFTVLSLHLHDGRIAAQAATDGAFTGIPDVVQIQAGAEQPLPVGVTPGSDVPKNAMVLISGLPATSVLSAGRLFASGTWALRLSDLPGLTIQTTANASGPVRMSLTLVTLDGNTIAERAVKLAVLPPAGAEPKPAAPAPDQHALMPTAALPKPTPEETAETRSLLTQGDTNLASGKVQVARLFYRRAAEHGSAVGALALAHTYDPRELSKLTVVGGVQPDPALAKQWYEKAIALGSAEAENGLRRLSAR